MSFRSCAVVWSTEELRARDRRRAAYDARVTITVDGQIRVDPDWRARNGYDPMFLGVDVPLPTLKAAVLGDCAEVDPPYRKGGDPHLLAYFNFSLVMNRSRRTAWFSAANIDGDRRFDLGKRQDDRWFRDARIADDAQLDQSAFELGIDRGHVTRREDVAWGDTPDAALRATGDTFHFTNCSLQIAAFNRGKDRWQGLERYLLENKAKKEKRRLSVITGPVFSPADPSYKNATMKYAVRCPLEFWKVCVLIRHDDTMSATAFALGQPDIETLPGFEDRFEPAAAQVTIAAIEQKTGLDFGSLKQHDRFAQSGTPGLEATTLRKPIESYDDIVV